ncbi:MAG: hypothetical protein AAF845_08420 [Bacteroidota bacterium]
MARFHSLLRFAVVLTLAVSTQGLLLAQAAWLTNQEWIAETLCVNPETDCDGLCMLADRMEHMHHGGHDTGHGHDEAPVQLLELALSVRAHVTERAHAPSPSATDARRPAAEAVFDTGREASRDVFHPPRLGATA